MFESSHDDMMDKLPELADKHYMLNKRGRTQRQQASGARGQVKPFSLVVSRAHALAQRNIRDMSTGAASRKVALAFRYKSWPTLTN